MSNQNRIALFVDIDNMPLNKEHIDSIISQLEKSGEIVFAKFYGVTDRRHRDIICDAVSRGFETVPPVNPKKRGSIKVFDNRILVDICEMVFTGVSINSIAIVANPVNHVQLFAKLRLKNIAVYVFDNLDDDSLKFADKVLSFGYNDPNTALKLKRAKQKEKPKRVVRPIKKVEDIDEIIEILEKQSKTREYSKEELKYIRNKYTVGTKVKLIRMYDLIGAVPPNTTGTISYVDDIGTIHIDWENGSTLGLNFEIDEFTILNERSNSSGEDN